MKKSRINKNLYVLFLLFLFCGCFVNRAEKESEKIGVAVSVEPFAFLADRIGGERVQIEVIVPPGKEPEHYQTTPEKIAGIIRSKILFCTGMPFEETLLPKLRSNAPNLKAVDLRTNLKLRELELHHHGEDDTHHSHGASADPHIWFAPSALKTEATAVLAALLEMDSVHKDFYQKNYDFLIEEIESVRKELAEKLLPLKGQTVYVFHPSYGYFCDEFGLEQRAIEFEGKTPKPQQLAEQIAEMKKEAKPPVIIVQKEFNQSPAQAVAEAAGGTLAVHSALERDVLQSMKRFADLLVNRQ
ncbi:MAG: zinc ABC transporter substrate-binding protein [Planctomycetaceae bacterium]|jgi:zinc transport system substrate-binding protein|nr:zinc ABC transporter substrate-binding protein [Planctomycetaceae bacterium]